MDMSEVLGNFHSSQSDLINTRNSKAEELKNKLQSIKKKKEEIVEAQQLEASNISELEEQYSRLITESNTLRTELNSSEDSIINAASEFYDGEYGSAEQEINNVKIIIDDAIQGLP